MYILCFVPLPWDQILLDALAVPVTAGTPTITRTGRVPSPRPPRAGSPRRGTRPFARGTRHSPHTASLSYQPARARKAERRPALRIALQCHPSLNDSNESSAAGWGPTGDMHGGRHAHTHDESSHSRRSSMAAGSTREAADATSTQSSDCVLDIPPRLLSVDGSTVGAIVRIRRRPVRPMPGLPAR